MVDLIIEVTYGSNLKYEIDKNKNMLRLDRVLKTSMMYPGNYGYFPDTLAGDGDPLDVLLISEYKLLPGILVSSRIIGMLVTEDEKGMDEKILAVPSDSIDDTYKYIRNYDQLNVSTLNKIKHFFENYKILEDKKWVKVIGFEGRKKAIEVYNISKKNFVDKKDNN